MVAIRELCARFPMAALHARPMQLAVGCAPARAAPGSGPAWPPARAPEGAAAVGEPVAVYDLETGAKRRALHFRCARPLRARRRACPSLRPRSGRDRPKCKPAACWGLVLSTHRLATGGRIFMRNCTSTHAGQGYCGRAWRGAPTAGHVCEGWGPEPDSMTRVAGSAERNGPPRAQRGRGGAGAQPVSQPYPAMGSSPNSAVRGGARVYRRWCIAAGAKRAPPAVTDSADGIWA